MVGVVIAAHMDHQRAIGDVGQFFQAGSQDRVDGIAIAIHKKRRQVAQMALSPRKTMLLRFLGVVMPARGSRRNRLALLLRGIATWILVDMKSMDAAAEAFDLGSEDQPIGCFRDHDSADRLAVPLCIDFMHFDFGIGQRITRQANGCR